MAIRVPENRSWYVIFEVSCANWYYKSKERGKTTSKRKSRGVEIGDGRNQGEATASGRASLWK